ncbi:MAG TPA: hypothetical protein VKF37_00145 [Chloroflexota bacterium]|nr:hypothetical protein [Chloroflexota bacterium]
MPAHQHALLYVGYKSIVPLPSMPVGAAPYRVGMWLVAGAVLVGGDAPNREGGVARQGR